MSGGKNWRSSEAKMPSLLRGLTLILLLAIVLSAAARAHEDHDHRSHEEDEVLSEEVLEEKQQAYFREGSARDLQDDPTQYCTTIMEVNQVDQIQTVAVQATYSVTTGYPNNLRRCVIFRPNRDMFLEVTITFLSTEPNFDFVEVYPIGSYDQKTQLVSNVGQRLLQLSGIILPAEVTNRRVVGRVGETLMIVLRTDGNRNIWTGFQANVESKYRDCFNGMAFIQAARLPQVFSDGYANAYPPNYAYCWVIAPPRGEHVQIVFTSMNTERDVDLLEIATIQAFDMQRQTYSGKRVPVWGVFSGLDLPPTIDANVDELVLLSFRSDPTLQFTGFSGRVSAPGIVPTVTPTRRPTHIDCESNVDYYVAPEAGQEIADRLVSYYLDSAFCYVLTPASENTFVSVELTDLALINADEIEVFALREPLSNNFRDRLPGQLALATRTTTLPWFYSGRMGQTIVLQLKTDRAQTSSRFRARIRSNAALTSSPTLAPTAAECTNGMVEYGPPMPGQDEIVFDDNDDAFYSSNYQFCAVLLGVPGYRLVITFDEILIQDDRIEVYQVRTYSLDTKRYTGKTMLRRIDAANIARNVSTVITTRSELPTIVSLRTNFGRNGRGFRARARLVAAAEITSAPVMPSPSPTAIATEAPTSLPRCLNRMVVMRVRESIFTFSDNMRVVPRGVMYCYVLVPMNSRSFTQVDFTAVGLGTGATLQIGPIREYNQKKRTYDGYTRRVNVITKGARYEGRPGSILMIMLTTDRVGVRTSGFIANSIAPCFCPMYDTADRCQSATCGCVWEAPNAYCNFARQ